MVVGAAKLFTVVIVAQAAVDGQRTVFTTGIARAQGLDRAGSHFSEIDSQIDLFAIGLEHRQSTTCRASPASVWSTRKMP